MTKRPKSDMPVLIVKIENGRMVPATQYDAEVISTYRPGSTLNVFVTKDKPHKLSRKYWAVLNRVVETCNVRQRNAEDLHRAIRLKLGVVNSFETFGGNMKVELRSTAEMDEPEFEAFYQEAMELLTEQTGVDVETLKKESADVGDDGGDGAAAEEESAGAAVEGSGATGGPVTLDRNSFWHHPESDSYYVVEAGKPINHDGLSHEITQEQFDEAKAKSVAEKPKRAPSSEVTADLSDEDREWLKMGARMLYGAAWKYKTDVLKVQSEHLRSDFTPEGISVAARERMSTVMKHCKAICYGEATREEVLPPISMAACCEPEDVKTPDIKEG